MRIRNLITMLLILGLVVLALLTILVLLGPPVSNCFGMCGCNACPTPTVTK
jgi:hypothetical protein